MPGYTHLQRAQPVTLGHHLLAWVEMLERDRTRFAFAAAQAAPSPLGAGALAGSTLPIPAPPNQLRNSIDAVADRDFALDYLYAERVLFTHLSRIGEELVLWTTSEFGFARLPEEAATGSSIMPQKLNPDVAELVRGKTGTAIGRLSRLLVTVKGLPLAYNRDLQQDKPPVFAARADIAGALGALTMLVSGLAFDRERLASAAADPLLRATDAAEALVADGVPFRDAHEQVAAEVRAGTFRAPPPGDRLRSMSPPPSKPRRSAGHDHTSVRLTRRPGPAAHLRPRSRRSRADPRPRGRPEGRSAPNARARRHARALLLEALDADARVVLRRDGAPRRHRDRAQPRRAADLARRIAARTRPVRSRATSMRSRCARTLTRSSRHGPSGRRSR